MRKPLKSSRRPLTTVLWPLSKSTPVTLTAPDEALKIAVDMVGTQKRRTVARPAPNLLTTENYHIRLPPHMD